MNTDSILANLEILAESPRGLERIRELVLAIGTRIGFGINLKDSPIQKLSEISLISWGNLSLTKTSYVEDGRFLAVSAAGADGRINQAEHEEFTPVISAIGARCGTMFMPDERFTAIKNTMTVTPNKKKIDNWFLFYALKGSTLPRRGTAQPFLSKTDIENFEVTVPSSLEEQRIIVKKIDELMTICDELELKQEIRDNLRIATRKSVIDAISTATTQEELETAWKRISRNWEVIADSTESVSSLRSLILDLAVRGQISNGRVQKFDAISGLPVGWKIQRLDQMCKYLQRGKGPKYSDMSSCLVVSQKCVQWTGFDISKARFVDEQSLSSYGEERFLRNGDILWNSTGTGTVGRTAIYMSSELYGKVVADSHVTVLRAPDMNSRYLWFWTASAGVQSMISSLTSGTTNQQELNLSAIKSLLVPVPPQNTQNEIVTKVDELMALCDQLEVGLITRCELAEKFARSVVDVS